jgi:acyl-coenzyme A synthetase/AMP-(fatty) acid ligase
VDLDDTEYAVLVQEVDPNRAGDAGELLAAIRQAVADRDELTLDAVFLIAPRSVPKTSSGKIQRSASREALLDDTLPVVAEWRRESFGAALDRARAARAAVGVR